MKISFDSLVIPAVALTVAMGLTGCGDGKDPLEPDSVPTVLELIVRSRADSSFLDNSNVVLYKAESREALLRDMTDADGAVHFECDEGNYYVIVSAQGFETTPPENVAPIPFYIVPEDTTVQEIFLDAREDDGGTGHIIGWAEPIVSNLLILAESESSQETHSTVSGPDGFFVLYNLPHGTYALRALKSGYKMDGPVSADLSSLAKSDTVQLQVSEYRGSLLTGMVTFLASENSIVDITLLDPATRAVVPGLTIMSEVSGLDYRMDGIPDGTFLAWASLMNDGYVIDPDWVFKNPGGLDVSFVKSDTIQLNFSVTDAITIVSPTNPADFTFASMADSTVPTFRWLAYPSAKEYFIEVRDMSGRLCWGGFEGDGTVNHAFIGAGVESVEYNFDGQPDAPALEPGKIYQWRLWADLGTQRDSFVEQLISSSEDLRGLFQVPEDC